MNQTTPLPALWVERIFGRLLGIYGRQFSDKFSRMVGNVDAGMENAKQVWAEELAGFHDMPESIAHALKNLDPKFPPSAIEFRDLCRHAPKKEAPALPYKMTEEELHRNRRRISEMVESLVKSKSSVE
jgi:hypothetical protein